MKQHLHNPLSPDMKMYILLTVLSTFFNGNSKENLSKDQGVLSPVIISFILITSVFERGEMM